jgi:AcrR family transcriptional regulator
MRSVKRMHICSEARERRTQLMDAGEALFFEEKDYQSTTVRDIIERIGLAKGTFYHYFRSKNDLLAAILERRIDEFEEKVNDISNTQDLDSLKKIERLIDLIFKLRKGRIPDLEDFVSHKDRILQENFIMMGVERVMPVISKILKNGIDKGLFHTDYPEEALRFIIVGSSIATENEKGRLPLQMMEALSDFTERILGAETDTFKRMLCKTARL